MPLKNYQYNSILCEYDERRLKSHRELEKRQAVLYAAIPELNDIDREIASGSVQSAKLSLKGNSSAVEGLKARNEALSAKKTELILAHGYPADYLKPQY